MQLAVRILEGSVTARIDGNQAYAVLAATLRSRLFNSNFTIGQLLLIYVTQGYIPKGYAGWIPSQFALIVAVIVSYYSK